MKRTFSKSEWKEVDGASDKARRLKLEPNEHGLYICPVENCDSDSYKSQRGCRKHVFVKHAWFYYFDKKPDVEEAFPQTMNPPAKRPSQRKKSWDMPSFSKECQLAKDFVNWICSAGGGGKDMSQADQLCVKILKFCKFCCKNLEDNQELTRTTLEYCIGSVDLIQKFVSYLEEECKLASSGIISYLQSISHGLDFLRFKGLTPQKISVMLTTEVFVSRAKQCLRKKMRVEWNTVLSVEHFESMNCWASLADLQKVVPFHENRYTQVISLAKEDVSIPHDLSFATSFLLTVLFLRVKGSRPMTYQFLTVDMMKSALKDGVIDQTRFKTEATYGFDSLLFSDYALEKAKDYTDFVRPKLNATCDFLLVCKNGGQLSNLGDVFGRMVYQAIGKYVNPTRYRQIIETASSEHLSPADQEMISQDQKHTSNVAKVHYRKKNSRIVAQKASECIVRLIQSSQTAQVENEVEEDVCDDHESTDTEVAKVPNSDETAISRPTTRSSARQQVLNTSLKIDMESISTTSGTRGRKSSFTKEEDMFIINGLKKYGKGKWTQILNDPNYKFHPSRRISTLMTRAKKQNYV
ncbi:uncharacterized protein [Clytia hemisphaerica]|uniref:uncharacterized protein n=1 Tax=Clytia hemisphaerica TaxID=252671 RepID=UPI0034D400F8